MRRVHPASILLAVVSTAVVAMAVLAAPSSGSEDRPPGPSPLLVQSAAAAQAKSAGCLSCHAGIEPMHESGAVRLGCVDCHGGDVAATAPAGSSPGDPGYDEAKAAAHVAPRNREIWATSANPERSYTALLAEPVEFVRFVNPGDLRVAPETCGPCHPDQTLAVPKSPMTTSSIFWTAAAYANGIAGSKIAFLGEAYTREGEAAALRESPPPGEEERAAGALPFLLPLPRWESTQPGEYFRAFERGGIVNPSFFPEIGNPNPRLPDDPGRPDIRFSNRGPGTGNRISPALINLHKTRLNDPHLSFLGTNDHPGDFRSSGCTGCHVVYANDRDPAHSGPYARFGHRGKSATADPTIPRDEPGHPIRHRLTRAIPSSQCMVCHMHQPNSFLNTYLGYQMWDYETDGELLWPAEQRDPTPEELRASLDHNPEAAAARGVWTDPELLARVSELNDRTENTRFADYHGHGWIFRAVFSRDRKGNLLDGEGELVPFDDPERFEKAVHLQDIHLEGGMHCVDCHFSRDVHGDGTAKGEYAAAIEITCEDCHGTVRGRTDLRTSGPGAPRLSDGRGTDLSRGTTPWGQRRFAWRGETLLQRSMVEPGLEWEVVQVADTVDPAHARYNPKSARAKTMGRDGEWGDLDFVKTSRPWGSSAPGRLAHDDSAMSCYACHTSWMTSCFGCHLPQEANVKSPTQHYEGKTTRNYASYNPQVVRTDVFMLGNHGIFKEGSGNRIAPVRSSSALVLSSTNQNRQRVYVQQPPISTPGFSSQAFNPHVPHTVRTRETKTCTDCHLSEAGDNNAWMAQLLTQGTGFVNLVGRYAWAGLGEKGIEAVAVTEWSEPQAVYGSYLHRLAYPRNFAEHEARGGSLEESHHHHGNGEVVSLQLRGEYLFTAQGRGGFRVYDVANVDNKDFSERIVTAPVSPLGQDTHVATADARQVALPTTMPVAPGRVEAGEVDPVNRERTLHPIYRYAFVADREEGLIAIDVTTLTDRDPANNFLGRALTWNPDGLLDGARSVTVAGTWLYVGCDRGLVVLDLSEPLAPEVAAVVPDVAAPRSIAVQFRYAFTAGPDGLTTIDVTDPRNPRVAARVPLADARSVYVARTYAYVAAGSEGLAIVDVERPEAPRIDRLYDAGGRLNDTWDVKIGATHASVFAYVADGENGLHVVQLTSPATVPGYLGFSPRPEPVWIAHRETHGPAVALSRGLDRDRAADESGNQVSVFNRLGAGPLTREQAERLYLQGGDVYRVRDEPEVPEGRDR